MPTSTVTHGAPAGPAPARTDLGTLLQQVAGRGALVGLVGAGFALAAGGAHRGMTFLPSAFRHFPPWLGGPLAGLHLQRTVFGAAGLLAAMFFFYVVALACSRELSVRWAIASVVAAHLAFLLGPPLFSADVLGYIDFARLGALHGLNPYVHGASAVPGDAAFPFVRWYTVGTPYGPVFTLATYPLALLSVGAALWILKVCSAAASLGCVAMVWRIARQRGHDPVAAAVFFGANPILLAHAVGGGHNDPLLMLVVLVAVSWSLAGRATASGAAVGVAAGIKVSSALVAPFMILGTTSKRSFARGAAAAAVAIGAVAAVAFGRHGLGFIGQLRHQQLLSAAHSVPRVLSEMLGRTDVPPWMREAFGVAFAAAFACALWRTWRGADWLVAAGWATLAALVTTAWLTPWYAVWVLALAAAAGDRRLRLGVLVFCAYVIGTRVIPILVFNLNTGLT